MLLEFTSAYVDMLQNVHHGNALAEQMLIWLMLFLLNLFNGLVPLLEQTIVNVMNMKILTEQAGLALYWPQSLSAAMVVRIRAHNQNYITSTEYLSTVIQETIKLL